METAKEFALIPMIESGLPIRQNATGTEADMLPNFAVSRARLASALALAVWVFFQASTTAAEPPPLAAPLLTLPLTTLSALPSAQAVPTQSRRESPVRKGATEWSAITGAGIGIAGGTSNANFWAMHLRWGHVLTTDHGPGFLRGNLEYAVEVLPAFVISQSTNVFGGGITPLLLQYNFAGGRRFVPFIQAGAGLLFTTPKVPENTSQFNFTPQGGIGVYWFRQPRSAVAFGVRYHHISNAGTAERNPGHNALYFYTGISWWR